MPDPSQDMLFMSRLFYFGIHVICWILLFIYDNPFRRMVMSTQLIEPIIFTALVFYSNYLILSVGKNPGFYTNKLLSKISIEIQEIQQVQKSESTITLDNETSEALLSNHETSEQHQRQKDYNAQVGNQIVIQIDDDKKLPAKLWCEKCEHFMYYRSKHCNHCKACVARFDHHCFWIGACVGELNHRLFYLFLLVQSTVHVMLFKYFWYALDYYPYKTQKKNNEIVYSQEYGAYMVMTFIVALLNLFTLGLLFYHSFLIISGRTTWEHAKSHRIHYMKVYPKNFHPFDQGVLQNLINTFFPGDKPKDWELPLLPNQKDKKQAFNYFNNEYYSCC